MPSPIKSLTEAMGEIKKLNDFTSDTGTLVKQLADQYKPVVDHIRSEVENALSELRELQAAIGNPNALLEDEKLDNASTPFTDSRSE